MKMPQSESTATVPKRKFHGGREESPITFKAKVTREAAWTPRHLKAEKCQRRKRRNSGREVSISPVPRQRGKEGLLTPGNEPPDTLREPRDSGCYQKCKMFRPHLVGKAQQRCQVPRGRRGCSWYPDVEKGVSGIGRDKLQTENMKDEGMRRTSSNYTQWVGLVDPLTCELSTD